MVGTVPTFYKITITRALVEAVERGRAEISSTTDICAEIYSPGS